MSYEKEIVLFKKKQNSVFSAIDLIKILEDHSWKPTLLTIDCGSDFNWVNAEDKADLERILKHKTVMDEYIGFTLQNSINEKFVTVNISKDIIIYTLDIEKNECENTLFLWFHTQLVDNIDIIKGLIEKVEWRSNYNNIVISLIEY
ncbi:hypothetical protein [Flammeovirga sp. SJP92]|uniref:hypothetical protein n=1 Tax=Flammeovirga sp. SJP92 TaxID=1775430 RepID=UPI000788DFC5|nr:hypothetical protein [Flammeovirga sp. SJP92]KXX66632.1 hypothetical protein AVL50_31550 [Flammeovirga sp. SJP92]